MKTISKTMVGYNNSNTKRYYEKEISMASLAMKNIVKQNTNFGSEYKNYLSNQQKDLLWIQ
jgi:hypothetical protein